MVTIDKYKYCGIYKITIGKYNYIGQSQNIRKRITYHKRELKNNIHYNKYMQNVYNKHNDFSYKVLIKCEKEFLTILEQTFINIFSKDNLNLAPAGPYFTEKHRKNISKALKLSEKNKEALKKAHKALSLLPKTDLQIEASKQSVHSMNTPEANLKSKLSRQNNKKVRAAARRNADQTIYIFINKNTNESFKGLRWEFAEYLNTKGATSRISEMFRIDKSFRGWVLAPNQTYTFYKTPSFKNKEGIESASSDKTIYSFIHTKTQESFIGNRYEFAEYINVTSKQLSGLIQLRDKTYHKWSLNICVVTNCYPCPSKTP